MWLFYYSGKTTFAKSSFHFLKISIGFLFFSRNCLKLIMTTQPFRNGVHAKHQNRSFTNNKKGNATCVFRNPMYWSFSVQSHVTSAIDLETVPSTSRGNLWPIFILLSRLIQYQCFSEYTICFIKHCDFVYNITHPLQWKTIDKYSDRLYDESSLIQWMYRQTDPLIHCFFLISAVF